MKVFFLDCGYMTPKSKFVLRNPADPEAPFRLDVRPVLIQTGEHNILLDTGGYACKEGWPYEPKGNFPLHTLAVSSLSTAMLPGAFSEPTKSGIQRK